MKIIFLDIDGVLNDTLTTAREPHGCIGIDDDKVKRLRKIVKKTGACIILTSTWRIGWEHEEDQCSDLAKYMNRKLRREGLHIIGKTDHMADRGQEIREWLNKHKNIEGWIVLDDCVFPDYEKYQIMDMLVKTNFYHGGLKDDHVDKAVIMLNECEDL